MVLAERDDDEVMEVWFKELRTILRQIVAIGTGHWTAIAIAESKQTAPMSRFTSAAPVSWPSSL
jgi:hypothetical protein